MIIIRTITLVVKIKIKFLYLFGYNLTPATAGSTHTNAKKEGIEEKRIKVSRCRRETHSIDALIGDEEKTGKRKKGRI